METMAIIAIFGSGLVGGYAAGLIRKDRNIDRGMESAYLTGHVDGYSKAEHDLHIAEWKAGR